jgi:hypothetical protein
MRPAAYDSVQAALGCVDALRESVSALRPQELLGAICGIEVLARKTHAATLELDPDGPEPADPEDLGSAAGELHIRDRHDGRISFDGWLDALHGTAFRGLIEHLAAPRPLAEDIPDPRTGAAQRRRPGRDL